MATRPPIKINRILIVYKKSSYQEHALEERDSNYLRLIREQSVVTRKSKNVHEVHMDSLETIKRYLTELKIPFDVKLRYRLKQIRNYDLVLTIGGDGTFLETSHFVHNGIMMGINSVPGESVGYFCKVNAETFLEKMYQYIDGHAKIQTLHRIAMTIDGQPKGPFALNDILFANLNPAGTTRYLLRISGHQEEQKSSGIWVCPAPGSTAATHSAGGRKMSLHSSDIQYVVREPYAPPGKKYHLLKGILPISSSVEITSIMDDAKIFVDGPHCTFLVRRGSKIRIQNAHNPITAIW